MVVFDAIGIGLADIICESIELAFHHSIMLAQYICQQRDGRISRSFRATCAKSSPNVNRNWNFRSSVIVCTYALTGCEIDIDPVVDQIARCKP
jgi:hypothetical protein